MESTGREVGREGTSSARLGRTLGVYTTIVGPLVPSLGSQYRQVKKGSLGMGSQEAQTQSVEGQTRRRRVVDGGLTGQEIHLSIGMDR